MTGLNSQSDKIVEIAVIVTNKELTEIIEGPNLIIHQQGHVLDGMSAVVKRMHQNSGLYDKITASRISEKEAEHSVCAFLTKYIEPGKAPLCGNSIGTDIGFLKIHMPKLASLFHYRSVDVTSIKLCAQMWCKDVPHFTKKNTHRALDDIKESIAELKYYKDKIMVNTEFDNSN